MLKITHKDDVSYENNIYSIDFTIEPDKDSTIHSYVNGFIKALNAVGFLNIVIYKGFREALDDLEETIDADYNGLQQYQKDNE